jgi:putative NADH-flavin reductase
MKLLVLGATGGVGLEIVRQAVERGHACTENGRFSINLSLTDLEARLNPDRFLRIHRSVIGNLDFVDHLSNWFAGPSVDTCDPAIQGHLKSGQCDC